jgi:hypothetical protein
MLSNLDSKSSKNGQLFIYGSQGQLQAWSGFRWNALCCHSDAFHSVHHSRPSHISHSGGALAGYVARARQEFLALKKNAAQTVMTQPHSTKVIEAEIVEPIERLEKKSS